AARRQSSAAESGVSKSVPPPGKYSATSSARSSCTSWRSRGFKSSVKSGVSADEKQMKRKSRRCRRATSRSVSATAFDQISLSPAIEPEPSRQTIIGPRPRWSALPREARGRDGQRGAGARRHLAETLGHLLSLLAEPRLGHPCGVGGALAHPARGGLALLGQAVDVCELLTATAELVLAPLEVPEV